MAVDLALAKQHLRLDTADDDSLVEAYLGAAKAWVESFTGNKLVRTSVTTYWPAFTHYLQLFWGPDPDAIGITYIDTAGEPRTIADARAVGGRLYAPASGWPTIGQNTAIVLTYTAGFEETPADLDLAVLLLTADFHANREAGTASPATTAAVQALCGPYRAVLI